MIWTDAVHVSIKCHGLACAVHRKRFDLATIPGQFLGPVFASVNEFIDNPVFLFIGWASERDSLLDLPGVKDEPSVFNRNRVIESHPVVVNVFPTSYTAAPVLEHTCGVTIVAGYWLSCISIWSSFGHEIGVLHVPDSCAQSAATIPEAICHGQAFYVEVTAHIDVAFSNPKLDFEVRVFD